MGHREGELENRSAGERPRVFGVAPAALARLGGDVGSVRDGGVWLSERAGGCRADCPSVVAAAAVFSSRSCPVGVDTDQFECIHGCRSQFRESSAAYSGSPCFSIPGLSAEKLAYL